MSSYVLPTSWHGLSANGRHSAFDVLSIMIQQIIHSSPNSTVFINVEMEADDSYHSQTPLQKLSHRLICLFVQLDFGLFVSVLPFPYKYLTTRICPNRRHGAARALAGGVNLRARWDRRLNDKLRYLRAV